MQVQRPRIRKAKTSPVQKGKVMKIETFGQESPVKGLRIVEFAVVSDQGRRWINQDGSLSFRYGVAELEANGWIKLDERHNHTLEMEN